MKPLIVAIILVLLAAGTIALISFSSITTNSVKNPITGNVVSIITPDYVELRWNNENAISQKIGVASECIREEQENITCNWEYQEIGSNDASFRDYDIDTRLKFYQVIAEKKIGEGSCTPVCSPPAHQPHAGQWYDPCTGEEFKSCITEVGLPARCCFIGTDAQGWYAGECVNADENNRIHLDAHCDVPAQICEQKSDIFVKFTQPLVYSAEEGKTSINWLTATQDIDLHGEHPLDTAPDFLKTNVIDYISRWDPAKQDYYGAAFATTPNGARVVTGPFELKTYTPYFVGAKTFEVPFGGSQGQVTTKITWVGKMPEHVTFELKYGPSNSDHENYIVLPLDTTIRMASQLCNPDISGIPITQAQTINEWNPETQQEVPSLPCFLINLPGNDFPLEPGKVYKIIVDADANWRQI